MVWPKLRLPPCLQNRRPALWRMHRMQPDVGSYLRQSAVEGQNIRVRRESDHRKPGYGVCPCILLFGVGCILLFGVGQITKSQSFGFAGMLNFKLQVTPATDAKRCVNPLTQEPCIFKAKTTSNNKNRQLKQISDRCPHIYIYMFDRCDD